MVGSPGRLRHLIQANHIDVSVVRLLVLDEADKLMEKSFQADINYIFSVLPKEKQVIMNSATYPEFLKSVINKYVQNAQHICPDSTTILIGIKQLVITVKSNTNIVRQTQNRFEELRKILSKKQFKQCLIFCNYQVRVRDLCKMLLREKWPAEQLHGQQEQTDRLDALKTLQEYKCRILISTDLAARGIDASNVDLVINFEPPHEWQVYLHRIGRAGRFGSYGTAITILSEGEEELKFKRIIKSINSSLDLKNLWDEENFNLDEYDSSPETSIEQETQSNELLHKLIHGNADCLEESETFETLCNSFENSKGTIECFNDLLTCFESHKISDQDDSYNKFDKGSNNECFTSTMNKQTDVLLKLNTTNKFEGNQIKIGQKLNSCNECQVSKKSGEEICEINNNPEKHLKTHNELNLDSTNSQKQAIKVDRIICDLELDESDMYKALLDAGLPTSFSSSKTHRVQPKNVECLNDNENTQYNTQASGNIKFEANRNKNKHPSRGRKSSSKLERKNETHLNSECESGYARRQINHPSIGSKTYSKLENKIESQLMNSECQSDFTRRQKQSKEVQPHVSKDTLKIYKNNCSKINPSITDSQIYSQEDEINCDIHLKYANWYNQLKVHIEQVQISLYIDELSKM